MILHKCEKIKGNIKNNNKNYRQFHRKLNIQYQTKLKYD